ncbi:hypothetical protein [Aquipseudomonas alcaligenes]|uniref:hypothetical protein n=1 Tax=Aquipseudomonas alcaligenes TaxID=43263 RepID=UPI0011B5CA7F|nr:hypothetical protein [Pseudomonas alcaligenes]
MPLKSRYLCYRLIRLQDFRKPGELEISNVARLAKQVGCSKSAISTCLEGLVLAQILVCEKRRTRGRPLQVYSFTEYFIKRRALVGNELAAEWIYKVLDCGVSARQRSGEDVGSDKYRDLTDPERCLLALAWFEVSKRGVLYLSAQELASKTSMDRSRVQSLIRSLVGKGFLEEHAGGALVLRGSRREKLYSLLGDSFVSGFEYGCKRDVFWSGFSVQDREECIDVLQRRNLAFALNDLDKLSCLLYQWCMLVSRYYPCGRSFLERQQQVVMQRSLLEVCGFSFPVAGFHGIESMDLKVMSHLDRLVLDLVEDLAHRMVSKLGFHFSDAIMSMPVSRTEWALVSCRPVEVAGALYIRTSLVFSGKELADKFGVEKMEIS